MNVRQTKAGGTAAVIEWRLTWCKQCGSIYFIRPWSGGLCDDCQRCDRDCENCKFPDCIMDDVTEEELVAANRRDKDARKMSKKDTCGNT